MMRFTIDKKVNMDFIMPVLMTDQCFFVTNGVGHDLF